MKTQNIFKQIKTKVLTVVLVLVLPFIFTACTDDDESEGEPYFRIEESPTGLNVDVNGISKSYIVRSNRPWQVVPQQTSEWVKPFPEEGDDDGIFKIIVDANDTFDDRIMNFAFIVDGQEQPTLFRVEQEANIPYITIYDSSNGIGVPSVGGDVTINVQANVNWTFSIDDDSWLSEVATTNNVISLLADKNNSEERDVVLTVSSAEYPGLDQSVTITQSAGNIILEENFDWLTYGSRIFYTTSGETRMDSWTVDELANGWTSTENTFSSNQKVVYARDGFLKLGKTGYGGDLISSAFTSLEEPTKLKVTFKAVPYKTKGGTEDDNTLIIGVVGDGVTSVNSFTVSNYPDYDTDPNCTDIWESDTSAYEFIITDATASTRLKFLGGDYYLVGVGKGKNRIFLDDIKVEIIE